MCATEPTYVTSFGSASGPSPRLYYLDWLRVLAMAGIFFFHNARFYDIFSDWHVRNATTSLGASVLVAFMSQWIMPLFFLIAGASTYYALGARRTGHFVRERSLRLLVPLVFGMFVVVAPQAYFEAVSHGVQLGGYDIPQIYRLYLKTLPDLNWFHLWFLVYLFVFSLVTAPVFARTRQGNSAISRLSAALNKPRALLLVLVLSLALVDVFLYPDGFWGHRGQGGWNIVAYLLFFISGYLIFADARVMVTVKKLCWVTLGTALAAILCLVLFFFDELADLKAHFGSPMFVAAQFVQALSTWCWLLTMLGLGSRFLNSSNRFLTYANEAVLPFYILHQTIIIVIGFYVVQWNAGVGLKYLAISTTSFAAIMLVYELLVRRVSVLRFLFGMRPGGSGDKSKAALAPAGES